MSGVKALLTANAFDVLELFSNINLHLKVKVVEDEFLLLIKSYKKFIFSAEKSRTRRHLSEYTHVEAECAFITFEELLDRLEDLLVDVIDRLMKSPAGAMVHELNPNFKPPTKPFMRMDYKDAIKYLREHDIKKDDGSYYEFGKFQISPKLRNFCYFF